MPADDPAASPPDHATTERRRDPLFRSLIDEMMAQIRELRAHSGPWPAEERARVEADLERIMAQVRRAAIHTDE